RSADFLVKRTKPLHQIILRRHSRLLDFTQQSLKLHRQHVVVLPLAVILVPDANNTFGAALLRARQTAFGAHGTSADLSIVERQAAAAFTRVSSSGSARLAWRAHWRRLGDR